MAKNVIVPVFPLPIVVFPNEELRLHIYEPRYKQLIQDCLDKGILFGILTLLENRLMKTGTLVKLTEISKQYDDGRSDVRLQSLEKFEMIRFIDQLANKLYSGAEILPSDAADAGAPDLYQKTESNFNELCVLNKVQPYRSVNWEDYRSYDLGHFVGFTMEQEYQFLSLTTENERLQMLITQIDWMIEHSKLRANWLRQIHMNGEFRDFRADEWK